jgi:hypothetical protein
MWTFYNASGQQLRSTATVLATQAEMEAGSSIAAFVTPGRTQNHPGVAKVWCSIQANGTLDSGSYNVDSVTDSGTGDWTVVITTDFSNTIYSGFGLSHEGTTANFQTQLSRAAGSCDVNVFQTETDAAIDRAANFVAFGDQ